MCACIGTKDADVRLSDSGNNYPAVEATPEGWGTMKLEDNYCAKLLAGAFAD